MRRTKRALRGFIDEAMRQQGSFTVSEAIATVRAKVPDAPDDKTLRALIDGYVVDGRFPSHAELQMRRWGDEAIDLIAQLEERGP